MRHIELFAARLLGEADDLGVPHNNDVDIMKFINLVFWVAGVIAVIIVIIAGINYSLSSGDPAKTASAKNAILYSVIGLVIISSAIAITGYIIGKVSVEDFYKVFNYWSVDIWTIRNINSACFCN